MPLSGTNPDATLMQLTATSVALQSLVSRLLISGVIDRGDLIAMKEIGLQFATDLASVTGHEEYGIRLANHVDAWWQTTEDLAGF